MAKVTKLKQPKGGKSKKVGKGVQESLAGMGSEENFRTEKEFEVSLTLKLKPSGGGTGDSITILSSVLRGTQVMDVLHLSLSQARTVNVIEALLDNPSREEIENAERERANAQKEGEQAFDEDEDEAA